MATVFLQGLNTTKYNYHAGVVIDDDGEQVAVRLHQLHKNSGDETGEEDQVDELLAIKVPRKNVVPLQFPRPKAGKFLLTMDAPGDTETISGWMLRWGLPKEVARLIVSYFHILPIDNASVKCVACSSSRGDFNLDVVLNDNDSQWWISDHNEFRRGQGREWLEFDVSEKNSGAPTRVSLLGVKIPVLPYGPLSVRRFHIQYSNDREVSTSSEPRVASLEERMIALSRNWISVPTHEMCTLDRPEIQMFAMQPPIEATRVRIVCTLSAIGEARNRWADPHGRGGGMGNCVGLFQVIFW